MKLKKRQLDLITELYNEHLDSCLLHNLHLINAALELTENFPEEFSMELVARCPTRYKFQIKRVGYIPNFLKEVQP